MRAKEVAFLEEDCIETARYDGDEICDDSREKVSCISFVIAGQTIAFHDRKIKVF